MSKKDSFNAFKQAMSIYAGFFKDVVQEVGLERAIALNAKQGKAMGAELAGMIKDELGRKKLNCAVLEHVMAKAVLNLGMTSEFETKGRTLKVKHTHCPLYEGWLGGGLDHQTIETMCQQMSASEYDEIKKAFPQFRGCVKVRSTAGEPCFEEFSI